MEEQNKKNMMYVLAAIVALLLVAGLWYMFTKSSKPTVNNNPAIVNNIASNSGQGSVQGAEGQTTQGPVSETEQERLDVIDQERKKVLEEKAELEAQLAAASSTQDPELAQKAQELELELLELQNQEEYPPLPDPGL